MRLELKKSKVEQKIKECIKDLEKKNQSISKMDKIKSQDICDEYY